MKKLQLILASALAFVAVSCVLDPVPADVEIVEGPDVFSKAVPTGYYAVANVTVPLGTQTIYIEYRGTDGKKNVVTQEVNPKMITPTDGKQAEPFGVVSVLLQSKNPSQVSIYYKPKEANTKASSDEVKEPIVDNLPLDQVTSGEFGKTRYVNMKWSYGWENKEVSLYHYENVRTYPADIVMYDEEHNHTLRYVYVYNSGVKSEGYVLDEAYEIEDHLVTGMKYRYCTGCGDGCQFCMPWGCSCGCGGWDNNGQPILKPNPDFKPNGNKVQEYVAGGASTEVPEIPEEVVIVDLNGDAFPEPATYVTTDGDYTNYHSSGVVMFDDNWPELPNVGVDGKAIQDYNDLVVDYDIEAVTVSDDRLASEGWREQVKVVLHVRAIGSKSMWRVGVSLDNFDTDYVQSVSEHMTLDSWQNEHGSLPAWAQSINFQENSIHYDAVSGTEYVRQTNRPAIEIGQLQAFNGAKWNSAAGKDVYIYKNGSHEAEHVMNPALKMWSGWPAPVEDQYLPALADVKEPETLASMQRFTFYNTVPGYVNVAGGLYTYTVIYHMKNRAEMDPVTRAAAKQNMIEAVMNNMAQNFFAVKNDYSPIGLKGYQPLDYKTKDNHTYAQEYQTRLNQNLDHLNPDIPFVGNNGQIWAFKCPVLTRHTWERMYFSNAYPHFMEWIQSNGAQAKDWYKRDVDYTYLTCEW